jgi:hypothetical protein
LVDERSTGRTERGHALAVTAGPEPVHFGADGADEHDIVVPVMALAIPAFVVSKSLMVSSPTNTTFPRPVGRGGADADARHDEARARFFPGHGRPRRRPGHRIERVPI